MTLRCRYQLSGRNITIRGECVDESGGPRPCLLDAVNNNRHFVVSQTMGEASSTGGAGVLIKAYRVSTNRTVQRCCMPFHDNRVSKCVGHNVPVYLYGGKTFSVTFRNCSFQVMSCGRKPSMNNEVLRARKCGGLRISKDRHFTMTNGGMSTAAPLQFNLFSFVWRSLVCVAS